VHSQSLEELSRSASTLTKLGELPQARDTWNKALELLPPDSRQSSWIRNQIQRLESAQSAAPSVLKPNKWLIKFGPVAAIGVALLKGKALLAIFNAKFIFSLGAFFGVYWSLYGWKFGLGFSAQILFHELGHFIDIKRRGLPVDMPVFLPGLGAFVRWQALGVLTKTRAQISLAGPLAGCVAAIVCTAIWIRTGNEIWSALARAGAWLNMLNLIPVWALDGGQSFAALGKSQRIVIMTLTLALLAATHEGLLLLVAMGACWRVFTRDLPEEPSGSIAVYFGTLVLVLALLINYLPGHGAALP